MSKPMEAKGAIDVAESAGADIAMGFAHDLKSPLSAVAMNLDFALTELSGEENAGARAALEDVRAASMRAFRMILEMLTVARWETRQLRPNFARGDLRPLVERAIRTCTVEGLARNVRIQIAGECCSADVDPDLLVAALEVLLDRLVRSSRSGGTITVALSTEDDRASIELSLSSGGLPDDARAELTARGAARPHARQLFSMYFCRVVASAHDGEISSPTPSLLRIAFRRAARSGIRLRVSP